jgi:hypothetical protein
MSGSFIRALAALLFAGLLWAQSRAVREQPRRKRAFELAAASLLALAALQFSLAVGLTSAPLLYAIGALALVLLFGAVIALLSAWRDGELRNQGEQIAKAAQEYRRQRSTNDER